MNEYIYYKSTMTKNEEHFGLFSKPLTNFLYTEQGKREEIYGSNVGKYNQRVIKNAQHAISDLMFAYEKLPDEQKEKIEILTQTDILVNFVADKQIQGNPEKIISNTKAQLNAIIKNHIYFKPIEKLAKADFEKVRTWLDYLSPKNPETKGVGF